MKIKKGKSVKMIGIIILFAINVKTMSVAWHGNYPPKLPQDIIKSSRNLSIRTFPFPPNKRKKVLKDFHFISPDCFSALKAFTHPFVNNILASSITIACHIKIYQYCTVLPYVFI